MANEVHITGSDFPQWASETTLEKLLEVVEKLSGTSSEQKRILDKSFREIQKTGKSKSGGGLMGDKKDIGLTKALTTGLAEAGHSALDMVGGFDKLGGPLKKFGKALKSQSAGMKVGLAAMGGLFAMIAKGAAIYKSSADTMIGLANSGITIEDSFLGIHEQLAKTGMSLEQFNEMSTKYARVVGQNGWKAINNMVQAADKASGGFDRMALTTVDATEYAVEYLETQRMTGYFRGALDKGQAKAVADNMKQLTMYSKVLNVSRDDLLESTRTMLGDADLQAELWSMGREDAKKASEAFRSTSIALGALGPAGDVVAKNLTDIAASPNPYGSEAYQRLVKAGQTEMANSLVAVSQANKRGEKLSLEQARTLMTLTDTGKQTNTALRYNLGAYRDEAVLRSAQDQAVKESIAMEEQNLKRYADEKKKGESFNKFMQRVNKDSEAITKIADAMNKTQATFDRGIIVMTDTLIKSFGKGGIGDIADSAATGLDNLTKKVNLWLDEFTESKDPMGMIIDTVMAGIGAILTKVGELLVAAIRRGFALLKGADIMNPLEAMKLNATQSFSSREEEIEYLKKQHNKRPGRRGGKILPFKEPTITQWDIGAQASNIRRSGTDAGVGAKSAKSMSEFEIKMLTLSIDQQNLLKKQLNKMSGGAFYEL